MKEIMERLLQLQQAEARGASGSADTKKLIAGLRKTIPEPILAHYDRMLARGKTGLALVRNGVCGGCHMRLASGVYAALIRADDVSLCDCGRYLKLAPEPPAPPPEPVKRRGRRPKPPTAEG